LNRRTKSTTQPTDTPTPLPCGLIARIAERERLLICLDYDGTLSEIAAHPAQARPLDGAAEALAVLAAHPDSVQLAIVTGRTISEVRRMLGVERGVLFSGVHGMELTDADGRRHLAPGVESLIPDLDRVREWLVRHVPANCGFVIEDKRVAIAFHYRMADAEVAARIRRALARFVQAHTTRLRILRGKMIDEMLPRDAAGKGAAVRAIQRLAGPPAARPVYFGDDTTDEDAFRELREDGVGVLVGAPRASWARWRVESPADVVRTLSELGAALGSQPAQDSI
jgi:alpha,alpha-trehalase